MVKIYKFDKNKNSESFYKKRKLRFRIIKSDSVEEIIEKLKEKKFIEKIVKK